MAKRIDRPAFAVRHARAVMLFAAAALTVGWVQPASAQVRLSSEAGGNYTVNVMSWWQIPFRTVVRQQYDFSCGSAAVATLLTYHYNRKTPEKIPFAQMWKAGDQAVIRKSGFSMFDMKKYLDSIGLHTEGYRLGATGLAKLKRPAIVLLDIKGFKHFVVLKGVRGDRVLVGDPMLGLDEYSRADFLKMWNGIALAVAGSQHGLFNLAGDWGPWSKAPMEDAGLHVASDDFLRTLPDTFQLTPQILLAVNVGTVN